MIVNHKNIIIFILGFFISVGSALGQQEMPPPPQMKPMGAPPPNGLPIDNGLIILLIVALAFGIYKIIQFSKAKKEA